MGVEKGKYVEDALGGDSFNLNLNLRQKIWLLFLVPTALHCAVYIADIATDIALVERHYAEERCVLACITLALIYAPAIVFFVLTLREKKKRPKGGDDEEDAWNAAWVAKQLFLVVVFPIHAMHRFAGKLFWGLEALFGPKEQLEDSLAEAMKPSMAELYLLLQPFVQATPQVLLQTYIVMSYKVPQERTGTVQILSITTSLLSMAIAAACYMRFETQRLAGKQAPWKFEKRSASKIFHHRETTMTSVVSHKSMEKQQQQEEDQEDRAESPDADDSAKSAPLPKGVPQTAILSLPPLPASFRAKLIKASGDELPEDLQKELAQGQDALNIRSSLYEANIGVAKTGESEMESLDFTITLPSISPPPSPLPPLPPSPPPDCSPIHEAPLPPLPDSPPPSPDLEEEESYEGSVHEAPTKEATGTTTPETNLAEHPSREPLIDQTSLNDRPPTPPPRGVESRPVVSEIMIEGLNEDEMIRKFIAFTWWFFFILSRVLTLSTLAFFYPAAFITVSLLHYLGMTSYLFSTSQSDKTSTTILRFSLGFIFLFCFIEIRDRFREPKNFAVGFVVLCSLENVISSVVWFLLAAWTSWWFLYTFYLINISLMLSILAMGLFHVLFKPNPNTK